MAARRAGARRHRQRESLCDGYDYFGYAKTRTIDGNPVALPFASGNGGNKIYIVPSQRLDVAITSGAQVGDRIGCG